MATRQTAEDRLAAERLRQLIAERRARAVAVAAELRERHGLKTSRVWDDLGGLAFGFNINSDKPGDPFPLDVVMLRSSNEGEVEFRWGWEIKHSAPELTDPVEVAAAVAATIGKTRPARDARNASQMVVAASS